MVKIAFFDLDGTLRQPKSGAKFITNPTDQEPIPGAIALLKYISNLDYECVGITNQGEVAAGHKSFADCYTEQEWTLTELFPDYLKLIIYCIDWGATAHEIILGRPPFIWSAKEISNRFYGMSNFRKPSTGMPEYVLESYRTGGDEIEKCIFIGDQSEDEQCARDIRIEETPKARVEFFWAEKARSNPLIIK